MLIAKAFLKIYKPVPPMLPVKLSNFLSSHFEEQQGTCASALSLL